MKKAKVFSRTFLAKRVVLLGLVVASMSTIFVACEKPDENPDPEEVYYKMVCNENK